MGFTLLLLGSQDSLETEAGRGRKGTLLLLGSYEAKHQVWAVLTQRGRVNTARLSDPLLSSQRSDQIWMETSARGCMGNNFQGSVF